MNLQFENFTDSKSIRKYTKEITNCQYLFAEGSLRKWGNSDEIEQLDGNNPFYQLMPYSLDEGFFNWYVSTRSKYQFFKTKKCV
jgi:hypothetical protein